MNILDVENLYVIFDQVLVSPKHQVLAAGAWIAYAFLKGLCLYMAGFKKFGWSLLVGLLSALITTGALAGYFLSGQHLVDDFLIFFGAVLGLFIILDIIIVLITKRKSGFMDGLIGSILGNVIAFALILVLYIIKTF